MPQEIVSKRKLSESDDSNRKLGSSDLSDDEVISKLKNVIPKRQLKKHKNCISDESDSDDVPLVEIQELPKKKSVMPTTLMKLSSEEESEALSHLNGSAKKDVQKPKDVPVLDSSSDDETSSMEREPPKSSQTNKEASTLKIDEKFRESSDDDMPNGKIAKVSIKEVNSKEISDSSSSELEDEPLIVKSKKSSEPSKISKRKSESKPKEGQDESSDEEISLAKIVKASKAKTKSKMISKPPNMSDFQPGKRSSKQKINKKARNVKPKLVKQSLEEFTDEEISLGKIAEASKTEKAGKVSILSSSSENELQCNKTEMPSSMEPETSMRLDENSHGASSEEERVSKILKTKGKTKTALVSSDDTSDSDFEHLATKGKKRLSKLSKGSPKAQWKMVESNEKNHDISSEEEPVSEILKTKAALASSDDSSKSDFEPLATKGKKKSSKSSQGSPKTQMKIVESNENEQDTSSAEDTPLIKIAKTQEKSGTASISSDDTDDEPLSVKKSKNSAKQAKRTSEAQKKKLKSNDNDMAVSSDEEDKPDRKLAKTSKGKENSKKNATNSRIEHLKKYIRTAGIHIHCYDALFKDCNSIKSKVEKLLNTLQEKGLKGHPTLEKCKKLRRKIETKKEVSELDASNIIKSEGRPKRGSAANIAQSAKIITNSPVQKRFARLKDIIDSEESD